MTEEGVAVGGVSDASEVGPRTLVPFFGEQARIADIPKMPTKEANFLNKLVA
jgi:hypothetical protein